MEPRLEINKCLSREHKELSHLLQAFRSFMHLHSIKEQPDWTSMQAGKLLSDLHAAFATEIPRHFAVEEDELFPVLEASGLADLVAILLDDHRLIMSIIGTIKPILDKAQTIRQLSEAEWQTLFRQGDALVTELSAHAEKEEAALVPELEEALGKEQADEIYRRYTSLCH